MKLLYTLIIILSGLAVGIPCLTTANTLDSLLSDRQSKLQEYASFKNNMKERTWMNLIDLNEKAGAIINADNDLIWHHLDKEIARSRDLLVKNEKLMLEMAFLNKEVQTRDENIKEHRYLNNLFLMIILGLSIAFIISLAFLAGQFRRNKHAIYELERLWSMNDDSNSALREKEKALSKQIRLLEVENMAIQKELAYMSNKASVAQKKMNGEIKAGQRTADDQKLAGSQGKK